MTQEQALKLRELFHKSVFKTCECGTKMGLADLEYIVNGEVIETSKGWHCNECGAIQIMKERKH